MKYILSVRPRVMQTSLKLVHIHIFGKLLVLMDFYALRNFLGFWTLA